eukprot:GGOE01003384.1.p2 GENE.GGOE01003384.1~~GGOE01003384.1.p2  ORF type:complete len:157 (+),score=25.91 GGOE01003384.1:25-495(+)
MSSLGLPWSLWEEVAEYLPLVAVLHFAATCHAFWGSLRAHPLQRRLLHRDFGPADRLQELVPGAKGIPLCSVGPFVYSWLAHGPIDELYAISQASQGEEVLQRLQCVLKDGLRRRCGCSPSKADALAQAMHCRFSTACHHLATHHGNVERAILCLL